MHAPKPLSDASHCKVSGTDGSKYRSTGVSDNICLIFSTAAPCTDSSKRVIEVFDETSEWLRHAGNSFCELLQVVDHVQKALRGLLVLWLRHF